MAVIASTWPRSISSMPSAMSLLVNPMERMAMAMTPARGPGPKITVNMMAQTSSFTDLEVTTITRASHRVVWLRVVFWAAIRATGMERNAARMVPRVAMLIVSIIGAIISSKKEISGGNMRSPRSRTWAGASRTNGQ